MNPVRRGIDLIMCTHIELNKHARDLHPSANLLIRLARESISLMLANVAWAGLTLSDPTSFCLTWINDAPGTFSPGSSLFRRS